MSEYAIPKKASDVEKVGHVNALRRSHTSDTFDIGRVPLWVHNLASGLSIQHLPDSTPHLSYYELSTATERLLDDWMDTRSGTRKRVALYITWRAMTDVRSAAASDDRHALRDELGDLGDVIKATGDRTLGPDTADKLVSYIRSTVLRLWGRNDD